MKQNEQNLVWIDLEMSGLDADIDVILEISCIITDRNLTIFAESQNYVIHQSDDILTNMNDWCKKQHGLSGLTKAVQESTNSIKQVQNDILNFIKEYCPLQKGMLAGNTVWMDRIFLKKYMPKIVHYLHYKLIDVTSVQQLVQYWYPHDISSEFKKNEKHRALDDIKESIEELKHYRHYFFKHEK